MASTLKDNVVHWRKKLERSTDETIALNVIHKLSKIPVTVDLLQDTGIGKVIRGLAKKSGKVGSKASAVLCTWREVIASTQKFSEKPQKIEHEKHNSNKVVHANKESIALEKIHKKERHNGKAKHSSDSKKKFSSSEISKHLYSEQPDMKHLLRGIHNDVPLRHSDDENEMDGDFNSDLQQLFTTNDPTGMDENYNEKSSHVNGPVFKKQKLEENESEKSSFSRSSHSKSELKKECQKKKDKEKKSYSSSCQSNTKSSHKSQPTTHSSKSNEAEKNLTKKAKKSKDSDKKSHSNVKKDLTIHPAEAFTASEVSFEDCLNFNDIVSVKRKKSSKSTLKKLERHTSSKKVSRNLTSSEPKVVVNTTLNAKSHKDKKSSSLPNAPVTSHINIIPVQRISTVDIVSTLPQTQPFYRPLPQRNYDGVISKKKVLSNEDAIKFTSSRREKTAVYSGRKHLSFTEVPSLFESCTRILIENIDAIEYLGDLPYYLLKSVFERCTPAQLYNIEFYNPYLLEDTHELWEAHSKRDFRNYNPDENETWREVYWRAHEEREKRLRSITANISASMSKSGPARKVKLAYVDSVVKPPRDVARKQAKHGTALPVNHTVKAGPPSKATSRPTAPSINSASSSREVFIPKKPKVAPLMAKTLKSMKQCFRR